MAASSRRAVMAAARLVGARAPARGMTSFMKRQAMAAVMTSFENSVGPTGSALIDTPIMDIPHPMSMSDLTMEPITPIAALRLDAFPGIADVDPFELMASEVRSMSDTIKDLLGVDHPVLGSVAKYFFDHDGGKKVRPTMVMLMARALNAHAQASEGTIPPTLAPSHAGSGVEGGAPPASSAASTDWELVEASQRRLAEITEMIHTASLLHDDVIDHADKRRGVSSVNSVFGNKLAILAGDFLLARASVCLARLRCVPVVEVMSTVIEHLVKGEVMQMRAALRNAPGGADAFDTYMRKTFYKTGSLMANSCRSAALLGGVSLADQEAAYGYGKHVGLSFQLVDDMLDFSGTEDSLGKPAGNDLSQGLVTAPVLFASEERPAVMEMLRRQFSEKGDVEAAVAAVREEGGAGPHPPVCPGPRTAGPGCHRGPGALPLPYSPSGLGGACGGPQSVEQWWPWNTFKHLSLT